MKANKIHSGHFLFLFLDTIRGNALCTECGTRKGRSVPTNPPSSQATRSHPGKASSWMKKFCLWGEKKVSLFHTPSTGHHQFLPQFQVIKVSFAICGSLQWNEWSKLYKILYNMDRQARFLRFSWFIKLSWTENWILLSAWSNRSCK